jgi:phospholipid/cholesterol/gamma-HCH transport system ATP-binding protein
MSDDVGNVMLRLKRQLSLTSIVVTHDLDLMRKVADTVMFLYQGEAIYFGPLNELEACEHPHVKYFLAMDRLEIHGKIEEE